MLIVLYVIYNHVAHVGNGHVWVSPAGTILLEVYATSKNWLGSSVILILVILEVDIPVATFLLDGYTSRIIWLTGLTSSTSSFVAIYTQR